MVSRLRARGLLLSLSDTILGTVAGGAIAGLIGFLTTRYDRKLVRREAHLREHQDNLKVVGRALLSLKQQIWPLTAKGSDDLRLPKWDKPPLGNWPKNYLIADFVSIESMTEKGYQVLAVDKILYSDIKNHFPKLSDQLVEVEQTIRMDGVKLDELMSELSVAIYNKLSSSDLSVLKWTLEKGERAPLREIVKLDTNESQWYAGAVFLILIGEDPGKWPNEHAQLKRYGLFEGLQGIANDTKKTSTKDVSEMLRLYQEIFNKIDTAFTTLDELSHKMSLKHGCEYL